jgi:hypothetical protein
MKKTAAIYVRVSTASKVRVGADAVFEQNPRSKNFLFGNLQSRGVGA